MDINVEFATWWKSTCEHNYEANILYERYPSISKELALYFYNLGQKKGK